MKDTLLRLIDDLKSKRGTYKSTNDICEDFIQIGKLEAFDYAIQEIEKAVDDL